MSDDREISIAFTRIAELALLSRHGESIRSCSGAWTYRFTDANGYEWAIAVNGHKEAVASPLSEGKPDTMVAPLNALVYFNGWPFGILDPFGGAMGAGEAANEDTLIAALESEIAKLSPETVS